MFTVIVTCLNMATCPIPQHTYRVQLSATSKAECVDKAADALKQFSFKREDFHIYCELAKHK